MKSALKTSLVIMALVLVSLPLSAQTHQNLFKVNLLSPLVRTGSFFYERTIAEHQSVQLGLFYTGASVEDTRFRGLGITPEYRLYLSQRPAPAGIFVAPYARFQTFNLTIDNEPGKASYTSFGGGLLVGAQTVLRDIISLEAFLGPSYSVGNLKVTDGQEDDFETGFFDGFGVRFGVTIGVAF
jgi:hypothetical protein